jgi:hypothetical protein
MSRKRAFDSAIGSSPLTVRRRLNSMQAVPYVARAAASAYGARRAASIIQRAYRGYRRVRPIMTYARSLRRIYDNHGSRAAHAMKLPGEYIRANRKAKANPNQNTSRYTFTRMQGKAGGKFKKPRKLSKKVNPYQTKGFESTTEIHGTVSDPDCVYLGASTVSTMKAIEVCAHALLRQLFEKCIGIPITNIKTPLQGYFNAAYPFSNADGFRLQLTWMIINDVSGERQFSYETNTTDSIYTIVGEQSAAVSPTWTDFMTKLREWAGRSYIAQDKNAEIPLRLNIYRRDGNVTNFYVGSGGIDLRSVKVHYSSSCSMKLQNRSLSSTGSANTDTVDANPLQGYLYEFKGGCPMFKNLDQASGTLRLNRMFDAQAVILARAGTMTGPGEVNKEPPNPRFWSNCIKSAKVKLDPGDVKKHYFSWSTTDSLVEYLKKIGQYNTANAIPQNVLSPGKCILFALEDMINVNSANLIAVSYEVNRIDKCYITSSPYKVAQGTFSALTLNELAV